MTRCFVSIVVALVAWLASATSADACDMTGGSPFLMFDEAETVALTRVAFVAQPAGTRAGRVRLTVTESLKGAADSVQLRFDNSSCDPRVRRTRKPVLVFARADGTITHGYLGYVTSPSAELMSTLRRWKDARTADDRVVVLLDAMTGTDAPLQFAALQAADDPSMQATLDADQAARLSTGARALRALRFDEDLAGFYGKPPAFFAAHDFGAVTTAAPLADILAASESDAERIEAYESCGRLSGRIWHVTGPLDAASWKLRAENCRSTTLSADLEIAAALGVPLASVTPHDFEVVTDTARLADVMRASVGAARLPERLKAYERCARIRGQLGEPLDLWMWVEEAAFDATSGRSFRRHIALCRGK